MLVEVRSSDMSRLSEVIREETGNQVAEKNHSMIVSRIRTHVMKLGLQTMDQYWDHFAAHEFEEREVLRGLMTTHYTFFFREFVHFEVLKDWISLNSSRIKSRFTATQTPVRIWSAACSRGQEAYSLACFLELELKTRLGVPYEVVGTDIDAASVQYASNGVYPIKEVNTIPTAYLNRFWKKGTGQIKDFAAVHPTVKEKVRFGVANLLELDKWQNQSKFDVIFCRNVFIYFSEENVQTIAKGLAQRLEDDGLLVSGLSEPIRFNGWNFESVGPSCYSRKAWTKTAVLAEGTIEPKSPTGGGEVRPGALDTKSVDVPVARESTKYRVLCVDDSSTIQLLMKKIFAQDPDCTGIDVAGNGREAKEKLDRNKYDLITLDIHMPEVNGIEFLERFYDSKKHPPVIMISSVNRMDLELATKSISLGAFDYVEKPAMNNLQKSSAEILTKAKMALRSKTAAIPLETTNFDKEIATKIVVPDASVCLRLLVTDVSSPASVQSAEWIVRGQSNEYRSPALLVVSSGPINSEFEQRIMSWTERPVTSVKGARVIFKPNSVFLVSAEDFKVALEGSRATSVSLQITADLPHASGEWKEILSKFPKRQVLLDERLQASKAGIESTIGLQVSDISPTTSFPSLSVEYFANLRKAA